MKMKLIHNFFILGLSFFLPLNVLAQGLNVYFESEPLFNETNFSPGREVARWIKVSNETEKTKPVIIELINYSDPDGLGAKLWLLIQEKNATLYNGTLAELKNSGEFYLSDLAAGGQTEYKLKVSFAPEEGNSYQGKMLDFDILIGFQGEESQADNTGRGGGGALIVTGLMISNEAEFGCQTPPCDSVIIRWETSYESTSQVIYSAEGEAHHLNLSLPNYGYAYAAPDPEDSNLVRFHNIELSGLLPCTKYYYRVVSHASAPTISFERSFKTCCLEAGEEEFFSGQGEESEDDLGLMPASPTPLSLPAPSPGGPIEQDIDEVTEEIQETKGTREQEQQQKMLASLASLLKNLFKGNFVNYFPWWFSLALALYPLYQAWQFKKKRHLSYIWLAWFLVHLALALGIYISGFGGISPWLILALAVITLFLKLKFRTSITSQ